MINLKASISSPWSRKVCLSNDVKLSPCSLPLGSLIRLHRADFQATLLRHLPKTCKILCSKRLGSYAQRSSGIVDLTFEDGTRSQCDILVGADGYKSVVRRCMLEERARLAHQAGRVKEAAEILGAVNPLWSGTICYRSLIPTEKLHARSPNHRACTTPMQVNQFCS